MAINDLRLDSYLSRDPSAYILICSNSPELKNNIAALLHTHNVKLTWTNYPDELVDKLYFQQYSLIIINLPELNHKGTRVAPLIKNVQTIKHIPMILLYSNSTAIENVIEQSPGFIDYLLKPFNPTILKQKITTFIQLYSHLNQIKSQETAIKENIASDCGDIYMEINHDLKITQIVGHQPLVFWNDSNNAREDDLREILIKLELDFLIPRMEKTLRLGVPLAIEVPIKNSNYNVRAYPINWGAAIYFRNINKQTIYEQDLIDLSRFKIIGELASCIAHEIRNPMTTVRALLELAKLANRPIPASKIDTMINEIDRANNLTTELLTLAKKPIQKEICCLNEVVKGVQPLLSAKASSSNKNVIYKLQPCSPRPINTKEVTQLILNIALNGLDAMEEQGTNLVISTKELKHNQILTISDEGPGIPREITQNIWQPFFTTKDKGTGIGLTICKKIVENNQAEISVNSSNVGTTFTIQFK